MRRRLGESIRGSHGRILHEISDEGTRPSTIASGIGITRQAVGQRLKEMEELGWIRTVADPGDGRAVVVKRTKVGDRVLRTSREAISELEAALADEVGPENYVTFVGVLQLLGQPYSDGVGR